MKYRYDHRLSARKYKIRKMSLLAVSILLPLVGVYIFVLLLSPGVLPITQSISSNGTKSIQENAEAIENMPISDNQLHIPKIGVSVPFLTGDANVMQTGAWHRYPERGNPATGGNFVLSAHRFNLGLTPQQTIARSPFYNIHKLDAGDLAFVDYEGKRYEYEITKRYMVKATETTIEAASSVAKLTLYSCTIKGAKDGREVLEATLVKINGVAISQENIALQ